MRYLHEFEHERVIKGTDDSSLQPFIGRHVYEFIVDAGWVLKGMCNLRSYDPLSLYENSKCFFGIRDNFYLTGRFTFCMCNNRCLLKRSLLALLGMTLDLIRVMRDHGVHFTLEDVFGRAMVDVFVSHCTSSPNDPGMFIASPSIGYNIILHSQSTRVFLVDRRLPVDLLYTTSA